MIKNNFSLDTKIKKGWFMYINEWIGKNFSLELIYRASNNGWASTDFHKCCDGKGPTVVVC